MRKCTAMHIVSSSKITMFRDEYAFLSNFYPAVISYRGYQYANNEAAFQAQKALSFTEQQKFCLSRLTNPADAKRLGRKITLRPDWEAAKMQYMYEICMAKYMQHPDLRLALLSTGDSILIEENQWRDRYWGMVNGHGKNRLAIILMDIRNKLAAEKDYII